MVHLKILLWTNIKAYQTIAKPHQKSELLYHSIFLSKDSARIISYPRITYTDNIFIVVLLLALWLSSFLLSGSNFYGNHQTNRADKLENNFIYNVYDQHIKFLIAYC